MGRWLDPTPKHALNVQIPMRMYERCIEGMHYIGAKTMTEFVIHALGEALTKLGISDASITGKIPSPRPEIDHQPDISLAPKDDYPITTRVPIKDIAKHIEESIPDRDEGKVGEDILQGLLGYPKKD